LTPEEIENGQFRSMTKPGDGLRTTYMPKDLQDFSYYPCNRPAAGLIFKSRNAGVKSDGEIATLFDELKATRAEYG
jgi:hypothetical protein